MLIHYFYLPTPNTISTYLLIPLSTISACCLYILFLHTYSYIYYSISHNVLSISLLFIYYTALHIIMQTSCLSRSTSDQQYSMFLDIYSDVLFRTNCHRWRLLFDVVLFGPNPRPSQLSQHHPFFYTSLSSLCVCPCR
jgi:hypothetical protein